MLDFMIGIFGGIIILVSVYYVIELRRKLLEKL
jgi:hypothetical protein